MTTVRELSTIELEQVAGDLSYHVTFGVVTSGGNYSGTVIITNQGNKIFVADNPSEDFQNP